MAIEVVVNGFYRSGTTMIWDILKKSNPDKKVFYEPFNPYLVYYIKEEAFYNKKNLLHNMYLFQEYSEVNQDFVDTVSRKHPALDTVLPDDLEKIYAYLDIYDNINGCVLQVNRLHFYLEDIHNKYRSKVIHIIRNPFDVYRSIVVDYYKHVYKSKWKWRYFYQYKIRKMYHLHFYHFDLKPMCDFIQKRYGYSVDYLENTEDLSFKCFMVDWIVCNYYAIKSIEKIDGLLIPYEEIMCDSEKALHKIYTYTNLKTNEHVIKNNKCINEYNQKYRLDTYTKNSMLFEMSQYIYEKLKV